MEKTAPTIDGLQEELEQLRREVSRLRQREQQQSLTLESFHRQILDGIPIQVAVFDADLRLVYVNPASIEDPEQRHWIIGRTLHEYVASLGVDTSLADTREKWQRRAITERSSVTHEEELPDRHGGVRLFLRTHTPVFKENGELWRLIGYGVDITEHKELERRLMETQKLDAVGKLAGGVAHDFNNLLTAILGYCQLLASEVDHQPKLSRYVNSVLTAGHQATTLVQRLLAFGRQQHLEARRLDLNGTLREIRDLLAPTLGENIDLCYELSEAPIHIEADPLQIQQVILNLAVNARDAMPDGGRLELATRLLQADHRTTALLHKESGAHAFPWGLVELTVSDNGSGMDESTRRRVFEPFFTTKSQDTGPSLGTRAGLGLASVYGIVEQSGGHISVRSTLGEGSSFRIVLPAAAATPFDEPSKPAPRPGGGSEIILVTEDEETVRIFTCEALRAFGYVVLEATDGVDAMRVCQQHDGPIDLLLTDVVMPRMGGQELAKAFIAERPLTRIVYMSGYTGSTSGRRGELDPDIPFLAKPFHLDALSRVVRQELDRRSIEVEMS